MQIQKIFLAKLGNVPMGSKYVNPLQVYFCKGFFVVCRPTSGAAFFHKNAAINMYDRLRLRIVSV